MKTITMPFEDFLALEGELRSLKQHKQQQDELIDEYMVGMTPEDLQAIRSQVRHPFWEQADHQLQKRQANYELSMKGKK